jgi:hypothetical protein
VEVEGGRVVLISPHPESAGGSPRAHTMFRQLFRQAAGVLDAARPEPELGLGPEPEPEQRGAGELRRSPARTLVHLGSIRRTASGRVRTGGVALARQASAYDEPQAADPDFEPEPGPGLGPDPAQETAQPQPQPQPQQPAPPPTMPDGYSLKGLPYVECAGSPILFTAPHGLQVYRGGADGERRRLHLRERWSTEIALKLAAAAPTQVCASFIVWNHKTAKKKDNANLDPNYLTAEQQPASPFHRGLLRFKQRDYDGRPRFHIDVHGKCDRQSNLDLDVGMRPMEEHWEEEGFELLKEQLERAFHGALTGAGQFRSKKKGSAGRFSFGVEVDPRLHGYWGSDTVVRSAYSLAISGWPWRPSLLSHLLY